MKESRCIAVTSQHVERSSILKPMSVSSMIIRGITNEVRCRRAVTKPSKTDNGKLAGRGVGCETRAHL